VKVVDANVLLYAADARAKDHEVSRAWLDRALSGTETIAFAWIVILAFLRLATHRSVAAEPLTIDVAAGFIDGWLAQPASAIIQPGPGHTATIRGLLGPIGTAGNLMNDAHLAALAIENAAELVSFDADYGRFPGLRWRRPGE
jgi:toxin-antitoxin system PIN domain toxin